MRYIVTSKEEFEAWFGTVKPGDELENFEAEDDASAKRYAYEKYGPYGEDIKIRLRRVEQ